MPYVTWIEKRGIEKGLQQGMRQVALNILEQKLGVVDEETKMKIGGLPVQEIERLSEVMLGLADLDELREWLASRAETPAGD